MVLPQLFLGEIRFAHFGYEADLELLGMLLLFGDNEKFWDLDVEEDLGITIPDFLSDPEQQARRRKMLVPPRAIKGDGIIAACAGRYYS